MILIVERTKSGGIIAKGVYIEGGNWVPADAFAISYPGLNDKLVAMMGEHLDTYPGTPEGDEQ